MTPAPPPVPADARRMADMARLPLRASPMIQVPKIQVVMTNLRPRRAASSCGSPGIGVTSAPKSVSTPYNTEALRFATHLPGRSVNSAACRFEQWSPGQPACPATRCAGDASEKKHLEVFVDTTGRVITLPPGLARAARSVWGCLRTFQAFLQAGRCCASATHGVCDWHLAGSPQKFGKEVRRFGLKAEWQLPLAA